jgi:hypothetical protein
MANTTTTTTQKTEKMSTMDPTKNQRGTPGAREGYAIFLKCAKKRQIHI